MYFFPVGWKDCDSKNWKRSMKKKKVKRLRITEQDFLLANRKAAREEEILAHGKPISFRSHLHKSKKQYDRKRLKRAIKSMAEGSAKGL